MYLSLLTCFCSVSHQKGQNRRSGKGYLTNSTGSTFRMVVAVVSTNDDISKLLLTSVKKKELPLLTLLVTI